MLKKIKSWFSKKVGDIELDKTSNINPIGVARVTDIKSIIKQIEKIKQQIDNIQPPPIDTSEFANINTANTFAEPNTFNKNIIIPNHPTKNTEATNKHYVDTTISKAIDAIPPIDLTNFAVKNEDNKFVNQSINDNTPFIKFINESENETYGLIGNETIANTNLVVNALHQDLHLKAKRAIKIGERQNQQITLVGETSTNKLSVTEFVCSGGTLDVVTDNNKSFVNKEYVDNAAKIDFGRVEKTANVQCEKIDIRTGLYGYVTDQRISMNIPLLDQYKNKKVGYIVTLMDVIAARSSVTMERVLYVNHNAQKGGDGFYADAPRFQDYLISTSDLKPGSGGRFTAECRFIITYWVY